MSRVDTLRVLSVFMLLLAPQNARAEYPLDCYGNTGQPSALTCDALPGLGFEGCCDDLGRTVWCENDQLFCIDCGAMGSQCGWANGYGFYDCNQQPLPDPSGEFPYSCVTCDPACGEGEICQAGQCVPCEANCDGKECGSDGCTGSCGTCEPNADCVDGLCVACEPQCQGKNCGPDGCGGVCGECDGLCFEGSCQSGPGCEPQDMPGCNGCPCEACVCEVASWCCEEFWDELCAEICIWECGGCADLTNCGDGVCDAEVGENCTSCADDCVCDEGTVCLGGSCCTPDCNGKTCGDDGCGGSCGQCGDSEVCDETGQCIVPPTCNVFSEIACGSAIKGDLDNLPNVLSNYECSWVALDQGEAGFLFSVQETDHVVIEVAPVGGSGAPAVLLTQGLCAEQTCEYFSIGQLEVPELEAGDWYVVVERLIGGTTKFELTVTCQSTCVPQCDGKNCGDDGCWGTCGECGGICQDGLCQEGPGCEANFGPGCNGCPCQDCVCDIYPWCCDEWWDGECIAICIEECGGCPELVDCGDGLCDPEAFENCGSCLEDCGCGEGEDCYQGTCCVPHCEGKTCGSDGCGGWCGECQQGVCSNGVCMSGPGCVATPFPNCNGCPCQACVCAMDSYCCSNSWDGICVNECVNDCGGCADLSNCGDGVCDASAGESCGSCDDCACDQGAVCVFGQCCLPDCDGKDCGDDGCGGTCGTCDSGVCSAGKCMSGDGCVTTPTPTCNNCACEDCVCAMDPFCCQNSWDGLCVNECIDQCGGCADLTNCGDGVCEAETGENCSNCQADCACGELESCYQGTCCTGNCEGKQCGSDGCGGSCGTCPCEGCAQDAVNCSVDGQCTAVDPANCSATQMCFWQCGDEPECDEMCGMIAEPPTMALMDEWQTCLADAGIGACANDHVCILEATGKCLSFGASCFEGTAACKDIVGCITTCDFADDYCVQWCIWTGSLAALKAFWPLYTCTWKACPDGDVNCMFEVQNTVCSDDLESCQQGCLPDCVGKECGDDGCGGLCGECEEDSVCAESGLCVSDEPVADSVEYVEPAPDIIAGEDVVDDYEVVAPTDVFDPTPDVAIGDGFQKADQTDGPDGQTTADLSSKDGSSPGEIALQQDALGAADGTGKSGDEKKADKKSSGCSDTGTPTSPAALLLLLLLAAAAMRYRTSAS